MSEVNKSLSCTMEECEVSLADGNYLNWSKKKKDIMLNIANAKGNDLADQTPTPTRFIRNCEELGLFQDLQNVNPFDEMFKKAAESPKCSLSVPAPTQSDDTLHTPHILPQDGETDDNDFNLNISSSSDDLVIKIDDENKDARGKSVKNKLRSVLQNNANKNSGKSVENDSAPGKCEIIVVPPVAKDPDSAKSKDNEKIERIREMNRAAQLRCRKKRQIRINRMEKDYEKLQEENKRLRLENSIIKTENNKLNQFTLKLKEENVNLRKAHDHLKNVLSKLKNLLDSDPVLKIEEEIIEESNISIFTEPAAQQSIITLETIDANSINLIKDSLPVCNERTRPIILRKIMPKQ